MHRVGYWVITEFQRVVAGFVLTEDSYLDKSQSAVYRVENFMSGMPFLLDDMHDVAGGG